MLGGGIIQRQRCGFDQCQNAAVTQEHCRKHRRQLLASGDIPRRGSQGCSEPGCGNPHKGLGLCQSHLNRDRFRKYKQSVSVKDIPRARELFEEVGWEVSDSGCWIWAGKREIGGYGSITKTPIAQTAHRVSYAIHFGMIPKGIQIHHICTVRACVNPMHLQALTPQENTAEMFERREYKREIAALKREVARLKRELRRDAA